MSNTSLTEMANTDRTEHEDGAADDGVDNGDIAWLISEVKRLTNERDLILDEASRTTSKNISLLEDKFRHIPENPMRYVGER